MSKDNKVVKLYHTSDDKVEAFIKLIREAQAGIEDIIGVLIMKEKAGYVTVYTTEEATDFAIGSSLLQKDFMDRMAFNDENSDE